MLGDRGRPRGHLQHPMKKCQERDYKGRRMKLTESVRSSLARRYVEFILFKDV
jgi:hypothetical protein